MRKPNWLISKGSQAIILLYAVTGVHSEAQTLTTLATFDVVNGGGNPMAPLVQGKDGNFYGTTSSGGANHTQAPFNGSGTVFKMTPTGALTTLYSFCSLPNCADGSFPQAGLIQASDGNLYGTTLGANNYGLQPQPQGSGTVFKITPGGTLTTLHTFCSQTGCVDGASPYGGLIQASDGNLYGTTDGGGNESSGTIFKMTLGGALTTLYSFCPQFGFCVDGAGPLAGLIQASAGNFYGTTVYGGLPTLGQFSKSHRVAL